MLVWIVVCLYVRWLLGGLVLLVWSAGWSVGLCVGWLTCCVILLVWFVVHCCGCARACRFVVVFGG